MSYSPELTPTMATEAAGALLSKQWPKVNFAVRVDGKPAYQILCVTWTNGPTVNQVHGLLLHSGLVVRDGQRHFTVDYFNQYLYTSIEQLQLIRNPDASLEVTAAGLQYDARFLSANAANHLLKYTGAGKDAKFAEQLRRQADGYQKTIDDKMRDRPRHTHRMQRQADSAVSDGLRLMRYQTVMRHLADLWEQGRVPQVLKPVRAKWLIEQLMSSDTPHRYDGYGWAEHIKEVDNGIVDAKCWKEAHERLVELSQSKQQQEAQQERDLATELSDNAKAGIEGFFPTPKGLIDQILDGIPSDWLGDGKMLEPSAGDGDIAVQLVDRFPHNTLIAVEQNHRLYKTLEQRIGSAICVERDFVDYAANVKENNANGMFRLIVANPPFENNLDADHLRLMVDLLEPGGRIYCVMSAGPFVRSGKKETSFRQWFQEFGGQIIFQEGEYFSRDQKARRVTGVRSLVVLIEKPYTTPEKPPAFGLLFPGEIDELKIPTFFVDEIAVSPNELTTAFGPPHVVSEEKDAKVSMEWWWSDVQTDQVFGLLDWKQDGEGDYLSDATFDFALHASTDDKAAVDAFKLFLRQRVAEAEKQPPQKEEPQKDEDMFTRDGSGHLRVNGTRAHLLVVWEKVMETFGAPFQAAKWHGWVFKNAEGQQFAFGTHPKYLPKQPTPQDYQVYTDVTATEDERETFVRWVVDQYLDKNTQDFSYGGLMEEIRVSDAYPRSARASVSVVPDHISEFFVDGPTKRRPHVEWWFEDRITHWQYVVWDETQVLDARHWKCDHKLILAVGGGVEHEDDGELGLFLLWLQRAFGATALKEDESESAPESQTAQRSRNIVDSVSQYLLNERELHVYRMGEHWEIYPPHSTQILERKGQNFRAVVSYHKDKSPDREAMPYLALSDTELEKAKPYFNAQYERVVLHEGDAEPKPDSRQKCAQCGKAFERGEQKLRSHIDGSVICQTCYNTLDEQPAGELPDGLQVWIQAKNVDHVPLYLIASDEGYRTFNVDAETLNQVFNGRFQVEDGGMMTSGYRARFIQFEADWLLAYTRFLQVQRHAYSVIADGNIVDAHVPALEPRHLNDAQELVLAAVKSLPPNTAATVSNIGEQLDAEPEVIAQLLDELVEVDLLLKNKFGQYERK